jgi:hypothetical protein
LSTSITPFLRQTDSGATNLPFRSPSARPPLCLPLKGRASTRAFKISQGPSCRPPDSCPTNWLLPLQECHSDRSAAKWRNLQLLFASWPKISKRPRRRHRTVAPQTGSFLCKSVIPTGAKRSGGTCSCFSLRGRKFLNVRVADHSGITIHWVSFHEEEGNFKVMTGQERVMRTMKYAFIVSVLLFVLVTIQVSSKAAHPPAHSGTHRYRLSPDKSSSGFGRTTDSEPPGQSECRTGWK